MELLVWLQRHLVYILLTTAVARTTIATVTGNDTNNHFPQFPDCSLYHPTVKEEQPTGAYVLMVKAIDPDPLERGGRVTYSLLSDPAEQTKFHIDNHTGIITTKHMFNRDEPSRETDAALIVRATDNGRPQLDAFCLFTVTIEDINDNAPIFDKVSYEESIPQDENIKSLVMRISASDIDDGLNKQVLYNISPDPNNMDDYRYFAINHDTGVITLDKKIDRPPGSVLRMIASATDKSLTNPISSTVNLTITVVESNKKAPYFYGSPPTHVTLKEDFSDRLANIAAFEAASNTDETAPVFSLITGKSEMKNKLGTFVTRQEGRKFFIRLSASQTLDYERVKEYSLTIRVENKFNLAVDHTLVIKVEDVNDNEPKFTQEGTPGSVLENEPIGTSVMHVTAIDLDETPAFKKVTYELEIEAKDAFEIDPDTGEIRTLMQFDRETKDVYQVKVIAKDGAPSAILNNGLPNSAEKVFRITIADKNDHPPIFQYQNYWAEIGENNDNGTTVSVVLANDEDSASYITYSIVDGNADGAFDIEPESGIIKAKSKLDYEKTKSYSLKIQAYDSLYVDQCTVRINILNLNDELPRFDPTNYTARIDEEDLVSGCVVKIYAYDPDIADRSADQRIVYSLANKKDEPFLAIDNDGCLSLRKPLDRDLPNGHETWQVWVRADDEGGPAETQTSQKNVVEVLIHLNDVNDNAPYIDMSSPVIWQENQDPGKIITLTAKDNDGPNNGAPFIYALADEADADLRKKFNIYGTNLEAMVRFDREEQKEYRVPIAVTDSGRPPKTGVSYVTIIIGDENDNKMKEGSSSIFAYRLQDASYNMTIGRVYVDDPDDWDLEDKRFEWLEEQETIDIWKEHFLLDEYTGNITMLKTQSQLHPYYLLRFKVTENPSSRKFLEHSVTATVHVTVKEIPTEAVIKSGSIRFEGVKAEEFVIKNEDGKSKADRLKSLLAEALNIKEENVDVFTILQSPLQTGTSTLDVRFSAHGSPYYASEKLNFAAVIRQEQIENMLGVKIVMINIDECIEEKNWEPSCSNYVDVNKSSAAAVFTNTTSFVGVYAYVNVEHECRTNLHTCSYGGTSNKEGRCFCGPNSDEIICEETSIVFNGNGWAVYPVPDTCNETTIRLRVRPTKANGLIFYIGPESLVPTQLSVSDFIALEMHEGNVVLLVDYGTGTMRLEQQYGSDNFHLIEIILRSTSIELRIDECPRTNCLIKMSPVGINQFLNVNGPLQLGGTRMDLTKVGSNRPWNYKPTNEGFGGCIQNFTVNGKPYDLASPKVFEKVDFDSCMKISSSQVGSLGFDWSFWIAVLICLAVLMILLMAVAVHRRKVEDLYRDTDDIRENIINYEDEGGGEGDETGYDLNVLRFHYDGPVHSGDKYRNEIMPSFNAEHVPDICGFLDTKKHSVDNDPETLPFDDVRHYAYEGDGNSTGSLSSLASGTDEGDLNFDYLSNFGPRFRKLADMYGEDGSDEDSDTFQHAVSESWC